MQEEPNKPKPDGRDPHKHPVDGDVFGLLATKQEVRVVVVREGYVMMRLVHLAARPYILSMKEFQHRFDDMTTQWKRTLRTKGRTA